MQTTNKMGRSKGPYGLQKKSSAYSDLIFQISLTRFMLRKKL